MKVDPYLQRSSQVINRAFAEMANPLHLSIKLTWKNLVEFISIDSSSASKQRNMNGEKAHVQAD